jgi:hypothetical protein
LLDSLHNPLAGGVKVVIRETQVFLDGKKKNARAWSESDARAVPIMAATDLPDTDNSAFAFTSQALFEEWLTRNGLTREYQQSTSLLQRSPKRLERQQEAAIRQSQSKVVDSEMKEFISRLERSGLSLDQSDAFVDAISKYNPLTGPIIRSALLFEHVNGAGSARYLPSYWAFPDLSWIQFDDICSSVIVWGGINMWEQSWYRGRTLWLYSYFGKRYNLFGSPYYFNDVASSAVSWR